MVSKSLRKTLAIFVSVMMLMLLVSACGSAAKPSASGGSNSSKTQDQSSKQSQNKNPSPSQNQNSAKSGDKKPAGNKTLSIATLPIGTSFNAVGNGLAKVITNNSSVRVSVKPYAGQTAWGPLLDSGQIDLAVSEYPEVSWALKGDAGFRQTKNLRMMVRGNSIITPGFAVKKNSGINSIADLKGKRVAYGYAGSLIAQKILTALLDINGLSWKDVKKVPVTDIFSAVKMLQNNQVDAVFGLTPHTPIMLQVNNSVPLKGLNALDKYTPSQLSSLPQSITDKLHSYVPGTDWTVMKKDGYIRQDQIAIKYATLMLTSTHLSNDTVYSIMQTLWKNYAELHPIHVWLRSWNPKQMFDPNPVIPYHPGAVKFFKDQGVWTDQAQKNQDKLLKEAQ